MRFKNGSNKVLIEVRVVQFWFMIFRPNCTPLSSIAIIKHIECSMCPRLSTYQDFYKYFLINLCFELPQNETRIDMKQHAWLGIQLILPT